VVRRRCSDERGIGLGRFRIYSGGQVYWGDPYSSEADGYFHVTYYPEGGGSASDSTSDIYGSFFRIGELRVEDGVVTYKIKDSGGTLASGNLGEVADPFRQVQYVVLRAQRYSAYDLVDLRLSALNLYAGHETQVEDFEDGDGTWGGSSYGGAETEDALAIGGLFLGENLVVWWSLVNFWPVCHLLIDFAVCSLEQELHVTIDLLGSMDIVALQLNGGPSFDDFLSGAIDWVFAQVFVMLLYSAVVAINIYDMATIMMPGSPWCAIPLGVAIFLTICAYLAPIAIIEGDLARGTITHGTAAWKYFFLVINVALVLAGLKILRNVLGLLTSVLLGVVFGIHLMGVGIWVPWIEETSSTIRTRWGTVILLGALGMFFGLWLYHLVLSMQG
jgi:hypothetical protein